MYKFDSTYNIFNSTQYSSKTFSLKPPVLLDELDSYRYIVGFIDGDGCIRIDNKNDLVLAISSSSFAILDWIRNKLYKIENQEKYRFPNINNKQYGIKKDGSLVEPHWSLRYGCMRAYNILNYLNDIEVPFKLDRKWNMINKYKLLKDIK